MENSHPRVDPRAGLEAHEKDARGRVLRTRPGARSSPLNMIPTPDPYMVTDNSPDKVAGVQSAEDRRKRLNEGIAGQHTRADNIFNNERTQIEDSHAQGIVGANPSPHGSVTRISDPYIAGRPAYTGRGVAEITGNPNATAWTPIDPRYVPKGESNIGFAGNTGRPAQINDHPSPQPTITGATAAPLATAPTPPINLEKVGLAPWQTNRGAAWANARSTPERKFDAGITQPHPTPITGQSQTGLADFTNTFMPAPTFLPLPDARSTGVTQPTITPTAPPITAVPPIAPPTHEPNNVRIGQNGKPERYYDPRIAELNKVNDARKSAIAAPFKTIGGYGRG